MVRVILEFKDEYLLVTKELDGKEVKGVRVPLNSDRHVRRFLNKLEEKIEKEADKRCRSIDDFLEDEDE